MVTAIWCWGGERAELREWTDWRVMGGLWGNERAGILEKSEDLETRNLRGNWETRSVGVLREWENEEEEWVCSEVIVKLGMLGKSVELDNQGKVMEPREREH